MATRNLIEMAEKMRKEGEKNKAIYCYDLSLDELCELYELSRKDEIQAITTAFNCGFVLGTRAHSRGKVKAL